MTHIHVIVRVVDEVVPSGSGKVTSCIHCRSLLFYQVITPVSTSENATDISTYCAVCGHPQGGFISEGG